MGNKQYVVVVGTDYSAHGYRAVRAAAREAAKHPYAKLHVVHVVSSNGTGLAQLSVPGLARGAFTAGSHDALAFLETHVAHALAPIGLAEGNTIVTHIVNGDPAAVLMDLAWELRANLLVVGTRGRRFTQQWALGQVAEAVVRQATCAVVVIGPRVELPPEYQAKLAPS